ncbi:MAG: circularly permuted type 2 ATP-grasp protein, partial [Chthoniobacterales bacterium]|nr:circularly permuted type 2 ATP-grasp protein [Chthoniobacterales bacterium]
MPSFQRIRTEAIRHGCPSASWEEVFLNQHNVQPHFSTLLQTLVSLGKRSLRKLDESMQAIMREMGVNFAQWQEQTSGRKTWNCDILPHIFTPSEWETLRSGIIQRLRAFELFLRDIYSQRQIIRDQVLPVQVVISSPYFQRVASNLPRTNDAFLHLSALAITRNTSGQYTVEHHYFSNPSGISYMMQNRRALARLIPSLFEGFAIHSIANTPTRIVETLRSLCQQNEPSIVLLSPGEQSPAYFEHNFLARRMGIPVVQGKDLLVHNDRVYLRSISGLQEVHAIYSRVSDAWLDPLVFQQESLLGVPGLVHCIRNRTVLLLNSIGSQLADDRALLPFSSRIIKYYLAENPILPTLETYWLGDLDQREFVFDQIENFCIRPLYGENILTPPPDAQFSEKRANRIKKLVLQNPSNYVAQPRNYCARTLCFVRGVPQFRLQDHILFALRTSNNDWELFPGALTRISSETSGFTASQLGGASKDTWVLLDNNESPQNHPHIHIETHTPAHPVTSRVADSFYWIGRYLERAFTLAYMIFTIESLELEELNEIERKIYLPVWNKLLPPLENRQDQSRSKRSIANPQGRTLLALDLHEPSSIATSILRAAANADSIQESLSVEALAVIEELRQEVQRNHLKPTTPQSRTLLITRKFCDRIKALVPQFFGTAEITMPSDGGWPFCQIGQSLERAILTANALLHLTTDLASAPRQLRAEHALEIRLSAFLRLLTSRDTYRRIYQMRVEPHLVAEMLWQIKTVPRSVSRCLLQIRDHLHLATPSALNSCHIVLNINNILNDINNTNWEKLYLDLLSNTTQAH